MVANKQQEFRDMIDNETQKENTQCLFCEKPKREVITENEHAYAVRDGFPVTDMHSLIIPKRHVEEFFGLSEEELLACYDLLHQVRAEVLNIDDSVKGFNIGMNSGLAAGQTIFHCHIHLIPRRKGDVGNPRGGVRHIIAGKGDY